VTLVRFLANLQKVTLFSFPLTYLTLCFEVQGEGVAKNLQVVPGVGPNMWVAAESKSLNKTMTSSQVEKSI